MAEDGSDVEYNGKRVDVKNTFRHYKYLIWPRTKNQLFDGKKFDILALVKGDTVRAGIPAEFEMTGWMHKSKFRAIRETAGADHKLDSGTWHVHQSALTDFLPR